MNQTVTTAQAPGMLNARIASRPIPCPRAEFDALVSHYRQHQFQANDPDWDSIIAQHEEMLRKLEPYKASSKPSLWARLLGKDDPMKTIGEVWDKQWRDNLRLREDYFSQSGSAAPYRWGDHHLRIRNAGGVLARMLMLSKVIAELKPRTVLEIACGDGLNLLFLSCLHPDTRFTGIDLTAGGIEMAQAFQRDHARLPGYMSSVFGAAIKDDTAFCAVEFKQGDASKLQFAPNSFDLVISCVGLEQMESIRSKALSEFARVSGGWTAMLEPFKDFNIDAMNRTYLEKSKYFQGDVEGLGAHGLKPVFVCDDLPQKLNYNAGVVVCQKAG
jgi:SAM-dependent methyltransferase